MSHRSLINLNQSGQFESMTPNRRRFLQSIGVSTGILTTLPTTASVKASDGGASVTFEDQESNGLFVTISEVSVTIDAFAVLMERNGDQYTQRNVYEGESWSDFELQLDPPAKEGTVDMEVFIAAASDHRILASDEATVNFTDSDKVTEGITGELIEPDDSDEFAYPYYLHAPDIHVDEETKPILVEPNNTGHPTDDFNMHLERAEGLFESGTGRLIASELRTPFVVPVFPRLETTPSHDTGIREPSEHQLDRSTLLIEESDTDLDDHDRVRLDLQLLAMVDHAQGKLDEIGYPVEEEFMLNGFSATGNFVNRFAALHPDKILSVTAGGVNGMPILPIEEANGRELKYHVGVSDLEEITGKEFNLDAFRDVKQFIYMGDLDPNDTLSYGSSWSQDSLVETAIDVYGRNMHDERFPYAREVYDEVGSAAVFRMYDGLYHEARPIVDDLTEFHERCMNGDDAASLRDIFGKMPSLGARIESEPVSPDVGEEVRLTAQRSAVVGSDIVAYEWTFDTGDVVSGEETTQTFETSGGHNVMLTVTDETGEQYRSVEQLLIRDASDRNGGGV